MSLYVISESTIWAIANRARSSIRHRQLLHKKTILSDFYPAINNWKIYALRHYMQMGPARETQTFLISYALPSSKFDEKDEQLQKRVYDAGLTYHKEKCTYKNQEAFRIIIADKEAKIDEIIKLLN